jgi:cytochrome c
MKTTMFLAAGALLLAGGAAQAQAPSAGAKLYAEKTCLACHGKDGKKTLTKDYPKIAGQNAKYAERQMLDIKSGARANGSSAAMKGVMHLVSDDEIKVLAQFIEQMK